MMQAVADSTPIPSTFTATRLNGHWLWLARVIWFVLTLLSVGLFLAAIPIRIEELHILCTLDPCRPGQLSPQAVEILAGWGLSLNDYAVIFAAPEAVALLVYLPVAILIFWRRSDDWMAILVSLTLLLSGVGFFPLLSALGEQNPALLLPVNSLGVFAEALLILLLFLFPDGRFVPNWTRWLTVLYLAFMTLVHVSSVSAWGLSGVFPILIGLTAGVAAQVYRYRRISGPTEKQQTKWAVLGFVVMVGALCLIIAPMALFPSLNAAGVVIDSASQLIYLAVALPVMYLSNFALPVFIAISVLRYRLWDVDPLLNRSLVYGAVGLLALVLLFALTAGLQIIIGQTQPFVALVIAVAFSTVVFRPLTKQVQHVVDRYIYGFRFDLNELNAMHHKPQVQNPGMLTGRVLDGYEVRDIIGTGGMGEVYRGFGSGQIVAIKTMLPKIAQDTDMRTRFEREAQVGMQLDHARIAKVYSHGTVDGTPYLVMDYIEGQELRQRIKQDGKLDEETSAQLMHDICDALEIAHQRGFIHRDLKPSNIMIRPNGEAVLMDFGVTKITDSSTNLTGTGAIGTIDYMAPEQITAAKDVDHRADIYALGVMLFEMLTGEKPFKGSAAQILFAHLQQPSPDPQVINPEIPDALVQAIKCAMSKNPDDRFQSAGEFAAALKQ